MLMSSATRKANVSPLKMNTDKKKQVQTGRQGPTGRYCVTDNPDKGIQTL
jgi:hypothetical protein